MGIYLLILEISACLYLERISLETFILSALHLACVLLRTGGRAVSNWIEVWTCDMFNIYQLLIIRLPAL